MIALTLAKAILFCAVTHQWAQLRRHTKKIPTSDLYVFRRDLVRTIEIITDELEDRHMEGEER
jgi:hypothetical protein